MKERKVPTPPPLSEQQRRSAYAESLRVRQERAGVKLAVKAGAVSFAEAWVLPVVQGMKVYDLLRSIRGVGHWKAVDMLDAAGVDRGKTVRGCGARQRDRLFERLVERGFLVV